MKSLGTWKKNNANSNFIKIVKNKEVSLYSNSRRFAGDICNLALIKYFSENWRDYNLWN